jgi:hypothetical protein
VLDPLTFTVHDHQSARSSIGQRLLRDQLRRKLELIVAGSLAFHSRKLSDIRCPIPMSDDQSEGPMTIVISKFMLEQTFLSRHNRRRRVPKMAIRQRRRRASSRRALEKAVLH